MNLFKLLPLLILSALVSRSSSAASTDPFSILGVGVHDGDPRIVSCFRSLVALASDAKTVDKYVEAYSRLRDSEIREKWVAYKRSKETVERFRSYLFFEEGISSKARLERVLEVLTAVTSTEKIRYERYEAQKPPLDQTVRFYSHTLVYIETRRMIRDLLNSLSQPLEQVATKEQIEDLSFLLTGLRGPNPYDLLTGRTVPSPVREDHFFFVGVEQAVNGPRSLAREYEALSKLRPR